MSIKNLIFWFDHPPRVSKGIFNAVSEKWNGKTYYVCVNDTRDERKKINWDEGGYGKAEIIILSTMSNKNVFFDEFLNAHIDDIHIFNGYKSQSSLYLNKIIDAVRKPKIIIWSERPNLYGGFIEKMVRKIGLILYFKDAIRLRKYVSAYFAVSAKGVNMFKKFGWPNDKVFPFLYVPPINSEILKQSKKEIKFPIKMLYVGRFDAKAKGVDILMRAMDKLPKDNLSLEVVGGYGKIKDEVIDWAKSKSNVSFGGSWPSSEVCERMKEYDICIIPSKYDGWNVNPNDAIRAGTGIIITDNSGSDDLIRSSNSGIVIKSNSVNALVDAIKLVMKEPNLIIKWSENANKYANKISPNCASDYFIAVLQYVFEKNVKERPKAPWLINLYE
jgi:Glycosyltransferase